MIIVKLRLGDDDIAKYQFASIPAVGDEIATCGAVYKIVKRTWWPEEEKYKTTVVCELEGPGV